MKKMLALGLAGALAAAVANRRRLPAERVDVYREDETLETFEAGTEQAARILPLAREILDAAR
jgi:hypothetical protein